MPVVYTIDRQQAPVGDLYAMPEKKNKKEKKDSRRQTPTTPYALYQDPSTIERQQAPTGDLYAMPDKGKGKGSRQNVSDDKCFLLFSTILFLS